MLEELEIHNLGPIRSALIAPAGGMTAITGETGAGKSMLLSAIRLISGGPSDGGRVSVGANEAWAQGVFEVASSPAAVAAAHEAGFEPEDGELFLSRKVPASGRSRSMLSGRSVPRSVLGSIAAELVTIHGQADQLRIASSTRQREFLDRYAGDDVALVAYGKAWNALRAMDDRLERLSSQESSMRQQADYLRESIERINRIDPQPGEMAELRARRDRIENAAEIAEGVNRALSALDASQVVDDVESSSATDLIDRASQALRAIHVDGVFSELADRLDSISTDLSDVVFTLSGEVDNDLGMEDLDAINGRIHELDELVRRWGPELSDVIAWRDQAVFDLEDLDASPEKVSQLQAEREKLFGEALKAARAVSKRRVAAAKELAAKVTAELESLAMSGSKLEIHVSEREHLDASGADGIDFLFTPFPGSPQMPMGKSASGGELSRLMLALELVAAEKHVVAGGSVPPMTFIFDEVDAGVGGKTAVELGARLAKLAQSAQVIVVTHLPQVASWADEQYVVAKGEMDDGSIATTINQVRGEARVHEIARMLSGSESEASLEHAEELLKSSVLD
ncbi:DNA repair protein RecN [Bifidobacterium pseudocatenulatum]|uniref:DNA repair protein RecN n=2 Tax=Bifidobacterium pseudocatenulatum TaxID=28026 RepID=A0AAW4TPT1_BIFPS|nr:DNA repair protein RecN [Bifidobacterium pseudocatenulatum]MCB4864497.1 DNA repair protein RecN [Bifidobacterium pseudocatenulatum]MCB4869735.1 DNA repair protein RecN [Bifidobacterium pseudocatenulatum]MCB4880282.1 DNA repair protein RecN [Bifidobacterium pseudocatenulatum]MCB4896160.1 DNA repair protein RecN [Bifidobacterium pseudocatenulatum]